MHGKEFKTLTQNDVSQYDWSISGKSQRPLSPTIPVIDQLKEFPDVLVGKFCHFNSLPRVTIQRKVAAHSKFEACKMGLLTARLAPREKSDGQLKS